MERAQTLISVIDFKRLLKDLREKRPDICIRYRLLGEMWVNHFVSVFYITENGVLLNDDITHRLISIGDLSHIMQFEIDEPFQGYQPYYHYEVHPLLDYKAIPSA
ncbi:hypothetical protein [Chryseosolibacter indicus]|uniref:Uncharacterized protein n=1 Tax=Chryseosolibacter indicus TaxID=2782351 RepID=A0ABS5VSG9_9BACT|nr:hypothetical protein [Chryseosolibacter indicus]MBT1703973.1 hypothetical protein [Chryseosolibacter indicus]